MTTVDLEPGVYVVAVSGGVDSMSLLHMLVTGENAKPEGGRLHQNHFPLLGKQSPPLPLLPKARAIKLNTPKKTVFIVAHFDHGIRDDSHKDRQLVQTTAAKYHLPFVYNTGGLGAKASEAAARKARYNFLKAVQRATGAKAIITAHHQGDVIDTSIINLLRGTGRRGLSSLKSSQGIYRPLLNYNKQELYDHAKRHDLEWREDLSNQDQKYLRNYVRAKVSSEFRPSQRDRWLKLVARVQQINNLIDIELNDILEQLSLSSSNHLDRRKFISLPHLISKELLHAWLDTNQVPAIDRRTIERLVVAAKTLPSGKRFELSGGWRLLTGKNELALEHVDC